MHIDFGLIKQFTKAFDKKGVCIKYICRTFPDLTIETLEAGMFDGAQIRKLSTDSNFVKTMSEKEAPDWITFAEVVQNLLGKNKRENYKDLVTNSTSTFCDIDEKISVKMYSRR